MFQLSDTWWHHALKYTERFGDSPPAGCEHAGQSDQWPPYSHHLGGNKKPRTASVNNYVQTFQFRWSLGKTRPVWLTSWYNNICQPHGWFDVLLKGWLHKLIVLLDYAFNVPSTLCDVSAEPADEPNVWVCIHKDFHIQELQVRRANSSIMFISAKQLHKQFLVMISLLHSRILQKKGNKRMHCLTWRSSLSANDIIPSKMITLAPYTFFCKKRRETWVFKEESGATNSRLSFYKIKAAVCHFDT